MSTNVNNQRKRMSNHVVKTTYAGSVAHSHCTILVIYPNKRFSYPQICTSSRRIRTPDRTAVKMRASVQFREIRVLPSRRRSLHSAGSGLFSLRFRLSVSACLECTVLSIKVYLRNCLIRLFISIRHVFIFRALACSLPPLLQIWN